MLIERKASIDKDARKILFKRMTKNPVFRRNKILLIIGCVFFVALGLIIVLKLPITKELYVGFGVASLILGGLFLAALVGSYLFMQRSVNKAAKQVETMKMIYVVDDTGLRVRSPQNPQRYSWNELNVIDHPEHIELNAKGKEFSAWLRKDQLKPKEINWLEGEK